eukprot:TRINITY_DN23489_c0_g1_i2.p1 TRINITY_DN23489_c0_g1~~TRINITY_DN23489_c0_g1_i2.p1  ORF type:complete len:432 (-),score=84.28 TRINITY_DN23489_c0_g1_i2:102-1397(-)
MRVDNTPVAGAVSDAGLRTPGSRADRRRWTLRACCTAVRDLLVDPAASWRKLKAFWLRCSRRRKQMMIHEELFMNPFHKCARFGIFPVVFVMHALLIVLVTWQVLFYLDRDIAHVSSTARHLSFTLLQTDGGTRELLKPKDLRLALEHSVRNLFLINDVTLATVVLVDDTSQEAQEVDMTLELHNRSTLEHKLSRAAFVDKQNAGVYLKHLLPFVYDDRIQTVRRLTLFCRFWEQVIDKRRIPSQYQYNWTVSVNFESWHHGKFVVHLPYVVRQSGIDTAVAMRVSSWLVIGLAGVSAALIGKTIYNHLSIFLAVRRHTSRVRLSQDGVESLPLKDQLSLFSPWWIVALAAHALQVVSSFHCLREEITDIASRMQLLGWSCFFTWLGICQYFETFPVYYVTFHTMSKSFVTGAATAAPLAGHTAERRNVIL